MKTVRILALFSLLILSVSFFSLLKAQDTYKVASFNLRMDTPNDKENAWPNRKEFAKSLIQYHDFDIIGTQEGFFHQLKDLMEMPGFAYYGKGRDDGKEGGEHSAIFYKTEKFTLKDSGDFWLRENPEVPGKGWDATCCNRIASWVKLEDKVSKKTFYVFNVHFDHQGQIARRESGKLMIERIKKIAKSTPVILTGDFNSLPETEQMQNLSKFLKDTYVVTKQKPYGPVGTSNSFKLEAEMKNRIDYIFVSKDFEVLSYAALTDFLYGRFPSDHLPVVSEIRFSQ